MLYISFALVAASIASAAAVIRSRDGGDPPFQKIPSSAKADNTFSNGKPMLVTMPPEQAHLPAPDVYGSRSIDLPFGRLYHGNMKFFSAGQLNTPDRTSDAWTNQPGVVDSANQSACGIPDNAFSLSKVGIHPYFLKYAPLDRYCMQDVCISFWNGKTGDASSDMMLKVTDVCSTDPNDPTHCEKPGDIKVDRTKVWIMQHLTDKPVSDYPQLTGNEFTDGETWWFFVKCWADGLVQPAYDSTASNWFSTPALPNNLKWSQDTATAQWKKNNISYPLQNPPLPTYPNGAYNPKYNEEISPPITDWSPSDPDPEWCPVAGGKGWGNPTGKDCGGSKPAGLGSKESTTAAVATSTAVISSKPLVSSTFGSSSIPTSSTSKTLAAVTSIPAVAEASSFLTSSTSTTPATMTSIPTDTEASFLTTSIRVAPSSSSTSKGPVATSSTSSTAAFPSITPSWNSTSGLSPGLNGIGSTNPKIGGQQVVPGNDEDGEDDETCDVEPEEALKGAQEVVSVDDDDDDTCEW